LGHVADMGEQKKMHRVLVGIPETKGPHGRLRYRWENNLKMCLKELGWSRLHSSNSGQEQVTRSFEHGNESTGAIKCSKFLN
jgi:hypothetical protein